MPVVLVVGAPLESVDDTQALLGDVNTAVAAALGLQPHDVYATYVSAPTAMLGLAPVRPWPVALVHGGARAPEATAAALAGVRAVLGRAFDCAPEAVWVQWHVAS